jgi:hypothetical protein
VIARLELRHARADFFYDPDAFVPKNASRRAGGNITLQDVQIGAADGRPGNFYNGVGGGADFRYGARFQRYPSRSFVDESFHDVLLRLMRFAA